MQFRSAIEEINSEQTKDKGLLFEELLARSLPSIPETEIESAWRFSSAPPDIRSALFGHKSGDDLGTDLLARRNDGGYIAIQAKCYGPTTKVTKNDLDKFSGHTARAALDSRWLITTGQWTRAVEKYAITNQIQLINAQAEWPDAKVGGGTSPNPTNLIHYNAKH